MLSTQLFKLYGLTAIVFLAIDIVWLGVVASGFYQKHLGHLMRSDVILPAALLFYLLYVVAILVFAVLPGLESQSINRTLALGAFLGLVAYSTFDLTCLALFKNFPVKVVIIDLIWGTVLTATVAGISHKIGEFLSF
ncbi:MAG: DUF2177 family protein [Gemmatimonadetes bacterium]|nr:DUF2177 family protein [Gemmatimonadota bacterium]|tara:strand:- start:2336 stop:2746 length:411 start_codon:yes stop_codon:yes gene_type:complete